MTPRQVLSEYLAAFGGRWAVPRDPETISKELGVTIQYASLSDEVSAVPRGIDLTRRGGTGFFAPRPKPTIVLPRRESVRTTRDLFTWAHELAHFLVWESLRTVPGNDYWAHESACNWFAGEFLVPLELTRKIAGPPSRHWITAVDDLATACGVSWIVAANAMTCHSNGRIVFMWLEAQGSKVIARNPSVMRYCGKNLGSGASFEDAEFSRAIVGLCRGETHLTTLPADLGQLPTKNGVALLRRIGGGVQAMVRLHSAASLVRENIPS